MGEGHGQGDWPRNLMDYLGTSKEAALTESGRARSCLEIRPEHLAPNGFLQATVIVGLADTCCAHGTSESIAEGARFSTVELKTNLLSTAIEGRLCCEATLRHGGRTTQVWDAEVRVESTGRYCFSSTNHACHQRR